MLAHNRITRIESEISKAVPNVTTIVLTKNRIQELGDLDPLGGFGKLVFLSLVENPVTAREVCFASLTLGLVFSGCWYGCLQLLPQQKAKLALCWNLRLLLQNYRSWVIFRCPSVRFLDFKRVTDHERKAAKELFGTAAEPTGLASKVRTYPHSLLIPDFHLSDILFCCTDSSHQVRPNLRSAYRSHTQRTHCAERPKLQSYACGKETVAGYDSQDDEFGGDGEAGEDAE